jgi:hypothetical protein
MHRYSSLFLFWLCVLCWSASALAQQAQPNVAGRWEGNIEIQGVKLGIQVELARKENDNWTGTITIPAQMLKDAPLANVSVKDNTLSFELSDIPGNPTFKGNLAEDGKRISGELTQSGQTFSFKLERPGAEAAADSYVATPEKGAPGQGLEGRWQGTLDAGGSVLRVVLKVTKAADGDFTARLDSPDQGVSDLPIDGLTLKDGALRVELKRLNAGYTGTLSKDGAEIGGEWQQGGATWPLTFKRLGGKAER